MVIKMKCDEWYERIVGMIETKLKEHQGTEWNVKWLINCL